MTGAEELELLKAMKRFTFTPFAFQGFVGKREVVCFGWRYDFNGGNLQQARDIPDFLLPVRATAAGLAEL